MRGILIAMLLAFDVGVVGTSPTLAAPMSGVVIDKAIQLGQVAEQAKVWRPRFHRRLPHRQHWRHHWWR